MGILQEYFSKSSEEALRKKCERALKKLQNLGLVEKRGDKYCWYIYVNNFKDREDYNAKLLHSQKLIPALRRIAGIESSSPARYSVEEMKEEHLAPADMSILLGCVEDHLRAKPAIWRLLEEFREMKKSAEEKREKFEEDLMEKLRTEFGVEPVKAGHATSLRLPSFIGNNIPSLVYAHIRYENSELPEIKIEDNELIWLGSYQVAKGKQIEGKVKKFLECEVKGKSNMATVSKISKIEDRAIEVSRELQKEIRKLILKIESGEPLLGGCEECPKVYIKSEQG